MLGEPFSFGKPFRAVLGGSFFLLLSLLVSAAEGAVFTLAGQRCETAQLQKLQEELNARPTEAAKRVDALIRDHGEEWVAAGFASAGDDAGGWVSVSTWVDALPTGSKRLLAEGYQRQYGSVARQALEMARQEAQAGPEAFYAVARRYALSSMAAEALAAAGQRAIELGDWRSGHDYLQLARRAGWIAPRDASQPVAILDRYMAGARGPALAAEEESPSKEKGAASSGYAGALPFDWRWYGGPDAFSMPAFVPWVAGGQIYLAGARTMFAFKESGALAWQWSAGTAQPPTPDRPLDSGRGEVYQPAVLEDVVGNAAVLVVRQMQSASGETCLRAFAGLDGRLLWSSETDEDLSKLLILSNPAVAGRYVYAVAMQREGLSRTMTLLALDLMSGQVLWRTTLGQLSNELPAEKPGAAARKATGEIEEFWRQTAPLVTVDQVIVTPNVGYALAVGRFDGKLRWARPYPLPQEPLDMQRWRTFRQRRLEGKAAMPPMHSFQVLRRSCTPAAAAGAVVIAPQDTPWVVGLDATTGARLWQSDQMTAPTLVGSSGDLVYFAGETLVAVEARTGQTRWTHEPARNAPITGWAVVLDKFTYIPTARGVTILDSASGTPASAATKPPGYRVLVSGEPGKAALGSAEALESFGARGK